MTQFVTSCTAGTVSYASSEWSPVNAEVDCLGSGNDDIDREGRYGLPPAWPKAVAARCMLLQSPCIRRLELCIANCQIAKPCMLC